jgi:hypothetical protein
MVHLIDSFVAAGVDLARAGVVIGSRFYLPN